MCLFSIQQAESEGPRQSSMSPDYLRHALGDSPAKRRPDVPLCYDTSAKQKVSKLHGAKARLPPVLRVPKEPLSRTDQGAQRHVSKVAVVDVFCAFRMLLCVGEVCFPELGVAS